MQPGHTECAVTDETQYERSHCSHGGLDTYLFTTQLPWTNIAAFWTPRRTATESMEGPRRLIKLAKGMTFTEEDTGEVRTGKRAVGPSPAPQVCRASGAHNTPST